MPTLDFKGKQLVYAHHLTVPARTLEGDAPKSLPPEDQQPSLDDNLHALKALMSRYAGRVHCIYIDPPYNTGNEGWIYNDNVDSPLMQAWLTDKSLKDGLGGSFTYCTLGDEISPEKMLTGENLPDYDTLARHL